ncbi:hypothetical protein [Eubacterium ramulus]
MHETLLLLKSLAMNFPILHEWGVVFPKIITIVVPTDELWEIKEILKNFPEQCENTNNSDFRFFYISDVKKLNAKAFQLQTELLNGIKTEFGFPLILTDNFNTEGIGNHQFIIFFDEGLSDVNIDNFILYPENGSLQQIKRKIEEYKKKAASVEEFCFLAAKSFIPQRAMATTSEELLIEMIQRLCQQNEDARDVKCVTEMFLNCLYEWQKRKCFGNICHVLEASLFERDTHIFYDDKFIYMGSKLFREITLPLTKYVAITSLKSGLVKDEILIPEKSSSNFTVKVTCRDENGIPQRIRMIRLKEEKINMLGEMSFISICMLAKGDKK